MYELLDPKPNLDEFYQIFETGFAGMTQMDVTSNQLAETRIHLIQKILHSLIDDERQFLLSVKAGEPNWSLLPLSQI